MDTVQDDCSVSKRIAHSTNKAGRDYYGGCILVDSVHTDNKTMNGKLLGLALLSALVLSTVIWFSPPSTTLNTVSLALIALGLIFELTAPRLPSFGCCSLGFMIWFALAITPTSQIGLAAVVGSGAIMVRALSHHRLQKLRAILYGLTDILALVITLLGVSLVTQSPFAQLDTFSSFRLPTLVTAAILYPLCVLAIPVLVDEPLAELTPKFESVQRSKLLVVTTSLAFLGMLLSFSLQNNPWLLVVVTALTAVVFASAKIAANSIEIDTAQYLHRCLDFASSRLKDAQEQSDRTHLQLVNNVDLLAMVQLLQQGLANCTSTTQLTDRIVELLSHLLDAETIVVFAKDNQGSLYPQSWRSPLQQELSNWSLLRFEEPLVQRAWESGLLCSGPTQSPKSGLRYSSQMAMSIPEHGVLYVGTNVDQAFGSKHEYLLGLASTQLALAWQSGELLELQQSSLAAKTESLASLESWAEKLELVASNMQKMLKLDKPEAMLDELEGIIQSLATSDYMIVVIGKTQLISDTDHLLHGPESSKAAQLPFQALSLIDELRIAACTNRQPLVIDDFSDTRFEAPTPETKSCLVIPILGTENTNNAIVLGSGKVKAFSRQDQDILFMLGYHLSSIFHTYELHSQLKEAHKALQQSEASLIQSSKMAAVGQLAAGIAHELNTPLGAIILGLDSGLGALNAGSLERANKRLQTAKTAATQAKEIVSKLLFYSREASTGTRPTKVEEIVRDVVRLLEHQLTLDNVSIDLQFEDTPLCHVNQNELQQVITNLVMNARDALCEQDTNRSILISTAFCSSENAVQIAVADNGPGIDSKIIEHLFEPFFTTKPVGQGTGLGLSVSHEIVKRHKGDLKVASEPGHTVFTISIPVITLDANAE